MKKQHTFNDSPLALQTEWKKKPNESIGFYTNMPQETMGTKILTWFSNSSKCEIRFHTESIRQNHFVDLHVRLLIKAKNIGTPV